jgi:hypothetical protein
VKGFKRTRKNTAKKIQREEKRKNQMGNTCLKSRVATWVDDNDEEEVVQKVFKRKEEKRKSEEYSSCSSTVKIKITKRQLEEIVRLSSKGQLPMELVLSSFIDSNNTVFLSDERTRKWRPNLQTISE